MDDTTNLMLLLFAAIVVLGGLIVAVLFMPKSGTEADKQAAEPLVGTGSRRAGRQRQGSAADRLRERAALRRRGNAAAAVADEDGDEDGDEDDADATHTRGGTRAERLAARKERKRAEKAAEREAREEDRAAGPSKSAYEERRRQRELEREEREAAEEAERERIAEERRKKEDEEAAKWLDQISVEGEGNEAAEAEAENQGLLQQFVDYIKTRKTVVLEELAAEFGLKTADAVHRVQALESMGRITGVMDDRGKFIFVSPEEMQKVADHIRSAGRVRIATLAEQSNTLVDLESKAIDDNIDLGLNLDEEEAT